MLSRETDRGRKRGRPVRTVPHAALEPDRRGGPASSGSPSQVACPRPTARIARQLARHSPGGATGCRRGASVSPARATLGPPRALLRRSGGLARPRTARSRWSWSRPSPSSSWTTTPRCAMLRDFLAGAGFLVARRATPRPSSSSCRRRRRRRSSSTTSFPATGASVWPLLRQRHPDVPVILITAFGGPRLRAAAERLGAAGYLDKPFRMARLLALLEQVLAPA